MNMLAPAPAAAAEEASSCSRLITGKNLRVMALEKQIAYLQAQLEEQQFAKQTANDAHGHDEMAQPVDPEEYCNDASSYYSYTNEDSESTD